MNQKTTWKLRVFETNDINTISIVQKSLECSFTYLQWNTKFMFIHLFSVLSWNTIVMILEMTIQEPRTEWISFINCSNFFGKLRVIQVMDFGNSRVGFSRMHSLSNFWWIEIENNIVFMWNYFRFDFDFRT